MRTKCQQIDWNRDATQRVSSFIRELAPTFDLRKRGLQHKSSFIKVLALKYD